MSDEEAKVNDASSTTKPSENGHATDEIEVLFTHRKPKKVWVEDTKNGSRFMAEVREMGDDEYTAYVKENAKKFQYVDGQPVKKKYGGEAASLICRCLYYVGGPQNGKRVPKALIQSWGTAIQQQLTALCVKVNGLGKEVEEDEGKD